MSRLYFLNYGYNPNTAATNRALAYLRGFSELGVKADAVFFLTDNQKRRITDSLPNINIEYYWDKWYYIDNKYLKHICYFLFSISFFFRVKPEDTVYMYNMADMLHLLLKKKGVRVFVEKTEHPGMYPLGSRIFRPSMKRYFKDCSKATGIITVSTALKQLFIENGVDGNRVRIVNMIVDENRFKEVVPVKYEHPYFAYCGTVSTYKDGVDILLNAFSLVHKKYPDVDLRIAGKFADGQDEKKILRMVDDLGISGSVVFMGVVQASDIPAFLSGSIAAVLARPDNLQAKNGFPGKLGEYLLSKSPVIVTAVGDIPLFVKDGVHGFVVEPDDERAFAQKMEWVMENPAAAESVGLAGADLAHSRFNYLNESGKLIDFLNSNLS
ncbi:glycosyltransferase family 4 protein [uncultured Bacteroides sp.]|uniref:glycosyltransferase family 4 protein n=1 Tax=uncultured Bacteroides sp. TaxID=162156 RepID=UPI002674B54E|nr:glycosyltransferase family 4 protein [uncultured Bacteroides sp.]